MLDKINLLKVQSSDLAKQSLEESPDYIKDHYPSHYVEGFEDGFHCACNKIIELLPKTLDYKEISSKFDELLSKATKEDFEAWLKMDEERCKTEKIKKGKI
jgi:hypothetical protein